MASDGNEITEAEIEDIDSKFGRSYLTINAIDGSIIDRSLGY